MKTLTNICKMNSRLCSQTVMGCC